MLARRDGDVIRARKDIAEALKRSADDASVLVRRRFTLGYTLNFGNKLSWVIVGLLVTTLGGARWFLR